MIKICVRNCDMNSTLRSVVPLAMFTKSFDIYIEFSFHFHFHFLSFVLVRLNQY